MFPGQLRDLSLQLVLGSPQIVDRLVNVISAGSPCKPCPKMEAHLLLLSLFTCERDPKILESQMLAYLSSSIVSRVQVRVVMENISMLSVFNDDKEAVSELNLHP